MINKIVKMMRDEGMSIQEVQSVSQHLFAATSSFSMTETGAETHMSSVEFSDGIYDLTVTKRGATN